jgi:hypothetical protein
MEYSYSLKTDGKRNSLIESYDDKTREFKIQDIIIIENPKCYFLILNIKSIDENTIVIKGISCDDKTEWARNTFEIQIKREHSKLISDSNTLPPAKELSLLSYLNKKEQQYLSKQKYSSNDPAIKQKITRKIATYKRAITRRQTFQVPASKKSSFGWSRSNKVPSHGSKSFFSWGSKTPEPPLSFTTTQNDFTTPNIAQPIAQPLEQPIAHPLEQAIQQPIAQPLEQPTNSSLVTKPPAYDIDKIVPQTINLQVKNPFIFAEKLKDSESFYFIQPNYPSAVHQLQCKSKDTNTQYITIYCATNIKINNNKISSLTVLINNSGSFLHYIEIQNIPIQNKIDPTIHFRKNYKTYTIPIKLLELITDDSTYMNQDITLNVNTSFGGKRCTFKKKLQYKKHF